MVFFPLKTLRVKLEEFVFYLFRMGGFERTIFDGVYMFRHVAMFILTNSVEVV